MPGIAIGEVARRTGLSQSTIRFYESEGLIPAPQRVSGWRTFDAEVVNRIQVIRMARELGFTVAEIRTLLDGFSTDTPPSVRWNDLARRKLPELAALVERATRIRLLLEKGLRCDCISIDDCIQFDCAPPVRLQRKQ